MMANGDEVYSERLGSVYTKNLRKRCRCERGDVLFFGMERWIAGLLSDASNMSRRYPLDRASFSSRLRK